MSIHFSREQVQAVLENHELWWEGKLDRALVRVAIEGVLTWSIRSPLCPLQRMCPSS